jgi:hypothetical protein
MTQENSWLVKYDREEPIDSELVHMFPSFDGLSWSVHSWEHLAELMRHVVEDDEDRKNKSVIASRDIRHNLSYEKIGNRIKELLY